MEATKGPLREDKEPLVGQFCLLRNVDLLGLRSTTYPDGVLGALSNCDDSETLRVSNSVTHNALTMADRLMSRGLAVSVENPAASLFLDSLD